MCRARRDRCSLRHALAPRANYHHQTATPRPHPRIHGRFSRAYISRLKHCAQAHAQAHLAFLSPRPPALLFTYSLIALDSACLFAIPSLVDSPESRSARDYISYLVFSTPPHRFQPPLLQTITTFLYDPEQEIVSNMASKQKAQKPAAAKEVKTSQLPAWLHTLME